MTSPNEPQRLSHPQSPLDLPELASEDDVRQPSRKSTVDEPDRVSPTAACPSTKSVNHSRAFLTLSSKSRLKAATLNLDPISVLARVRQRLQAQLAMASRSLGHSNLGSNLPWFVAPYVAESKCLPFGQPGRTETDTEDSGLLFIVTTRHDCRPRQGWRPITGSRQLTFSAPLGVDGLRFDEGT